MTRWPQCAIQIPAARCKRCRTKILPALGRLLENVLEQAVPLPQVQIMRESILKNGALGSRMTGSGTAVFGLFSNKNQALRCARRMYGFGGSFFLARPVGYGAKLLSLE